MAPFESPRIHHVVVCMR